MDIRHARLLSAAVVIGLALAALATADSPHHPPPYEGSSALQRVKALSGNWTGLVTQHDGSQQETHVTYRTTSNGSAVIETIFKDTPMEMTSVYFDRDGKLTMTHYCAVANRPTMQLIEESDDALVLDYVSGEQMDPAKDMHIHGLKLEIKSNDQIVQNWTGYQDGKESHCTSLVLKRVE